MHLSSLALTALLPIQLFLPTSAPAQTASNDMATGDVWPCQEELIYVPREALEVPDAVSPGDNEIATGDVWPSRKKPIPQEALAPTAVDARAPGTTPR